MKKNKSIKAEILFYFVITYVMVAGGWWSYLLYIKNEDANSAKKELLWCKMKTEGITDRQVFLKSNEYTKLETEYNKQKWMIISESAVLLILALFGIWRIAKSRQRELALANQQRNFLLSITHELKSPIATIKLTLDTFKTRQLNKEQSDMLTENALADTDRLNKLVEDLLLAARVDGGYQYNFEEVNLIEIIEECIIITAKHYTGEILFDNKSQNISLKKGDKATLIYVILNILENAIKYTNHSSKILINLSTKKDNSLCIEIKDFGPGIPKAERENIFNKFYRIGNEDTRKTKGTGLGLYIAEQVVIAHKGSITVSDNYPTGTVFSILLPQNK
ncbi:MAG: HAMP domain-containing histidine kinase [Saprospiraceae bacterium]|nr:HAMP domain-containing histidine kinase [Saprospiraceae bacterium]